MAKKHFFEQQEYTQKYLLPYFQKNIPNFHKQKILEIGCAEGGLIDILQKLGMDVTGIEISEERIKTAHELNPTLKIVAGDITNKSIITQLNEKYDVIIMREVIEHIHDKFSAFSNISELCKEHGYLYVSFPPKCSPFAGHQQIAASLLRIIPYLHLLPQNILKSIAIILREKSDFVDEIKLHFSTGMKINMFEKLCQIYNFSPIIKELFIFRPIYAYRYGIPKLKMPNIYVLREIFTFGYETLLRKN